LSSQRVTEKGPDPVFSPRLLASPVGYAAEPGFGVLEYDEDGYEGDSTVKGKVRRMNGVVQTLGLHARGARPVAATGSSEPSAQAPSVINVGCDGMGDRDR
jgi:hypothetical protein